MFRHYITSIDYAKLIEQQANNVSLDQIQSRKNKSKLQSRSKMMVKKMNSKVK